MNAEKSVEAENYLRGVMKKTKFGEINIEWKILTGRPAETLADYATKNEVDLIVISTHGRCGVSRWVWRRVADRVPRSACVPVLMVRAPGCIPGV